MFVRVVVLAPCHGSQLILNMTPNHTLQRTRLKWRAAEGGRWATLRLL